MSLAERFTPGFYHGDPEVSINSLTVSTVYRYMLLLSEEYKSVTIGVSGLIKNPAFNRV